jgi:hypothetical protein
MVKGPGNADAWSQLDDITYDIENVLDVETVEHIGYGTNNVPAALLKFTEILG